MPCHLTRSIATLTSSPVTVRTDWPIESLTATSWRVIRPSITGVGIPFTVTTRITRMPGSKYPAGIKVVDSNDRPADREGQLKAGTRARTDGHLRAGERVDDLRWRRRGDERTNQQGQLELADHPLTPFTAASCS